jgi:hypothetical protein
MAGRAASQVPIQQKPESGCVFPSLVASNDGETTKKRECSAIMIVFHQNPDVV